MRRLGALALLCVALPLAAQDARLVIREAAFSDPYDRGGEAAEWETAVVDGDTLRLRDVLLPLGPGDVRYASVGLDPYTNAPVASLELSGSAREAFAQITGAQVGQVIALVFDGRVLMAPTVMGRIPNGRVEISGGSTRADVDSLVRQIREATGATDGRREHWSSVRSLDTSTPTGVAQAFVAASSARDWLTVARLLHPAGLQEMWEALSDGVEVRGDSIRVRPSAQAPGMPEPAWLRFSDVLDAPSLGLHFEALPNAEAVALLFATWGAGQPILSDVVMHGEVAEEPDRAHVVLTPIPEDPFAMDGFSRARVLTTEHVEGRWVVLVPESGW